ncbi:MAG TPA: hypothetical protein VJ570_12570 [Holophagaceae bacterium]|nr:hypothetical protein [Holophagaceae bacterium]
MGAVGTRSWIFLLASAMAWAQGPCDCIDKADIKERIARAQNAIKAYGEEMGKIGWTPYTAAGRDALQARVDAAISGQARQGIKLGAKGNTTNLCVIEVTAPTRCLEEAIRRHEQVHQEACQRTLGDHMKKILAGEAADRFEANGATMAGYMMEELLGYQTEIAFLQKELARLERDCEPPPPPRRDYSSAWRSDGAPAPPPLGKPKPLTAPPMPKPPPSTAPH